MNFVNVVLLNLISVFANTCPLVLDSITSIALNLLCPSAFIIVLIIPMILPVCCINVIVFILAKWAFVIGSVIIDSVSKTDGYLW